MHFHEPWERIINARLREEVEIDDAIFILWQAMEIDESYAVWLQSMGELMRYSYTETSGDWRKLCCLASILGRSTTGAIFILRQVEIDGSLASILGRTDAIFILRQVAIDESYAVWLQSMGELMRYLYWDKWRLTKAMQFGFTPWENWCDIHTETSGDWRKLCCLASIHGRTDAIFILRQVAIDESYAVWLQSMGELMRYSYGDKWRLTKAMQFGFNPWENWCDINTETSGDWRTPCCLASIHGRTDAIFILRQVEIDESYAVWLQSMGELMRYSYWDKWRLTKAM